MSELVTFSHNARDEVLEVLKHPIKDLPSIFFGTGESCYLMNSKVKGKELGSGQVGKVYEYKITKDGTTTNYAVKVVPEFINFTKYMCAGKYRSGNTCHLRAIYNDHLSTIPKGSYIPSYEFTIVMNGGKEEYTLGEKVMMPLYVEGEYECKTLIPERSILYGFVITQDVIRVKDLFDMVASDIHGISRSAYYRDFLLVNTGLFRTVADVLPKNTVVIVPLKKEDRYFDFPKGSFLCYKGLYVENAIALLCSSLVERKRCANFIHTFDVSICPADTQRILPAWDKDGTFAVNQYVFMEQITGEMKTYISNLVGWHQRKQITAEYLDQCVKNVYIQTLFGVCSMQHAYGIQHNDLHTGNVMFQSITPELMYDSKRVKECTHLSYSITDDAGTHHIYLPIVDDTVIAKIGDFGYSVKYSHPIIGGRNTTIDYYKNFTGCFVQWEARCNDIIYFTSSMFHVLHAVSPFIRRMISWLSDPKSVSEDRPEGVFTGMTPEEVSGMYYSTNPNPINRVMVVHSPKPGHSHRMNLNTYLEGGFSHVNPMEMILDRNLLGEEIFLPKKGTKCTLGTLHLVSHSKSKDLREVCVSEVAKEFSISKKVVREILLEK